MKNLTRICQSVFGRPFKLALCILGARYCHIGKIFKPKERHPLGIGFDNGPKKAQK